MNTRLNTLRRANATFATLAAAAALSAFAALPAVAQEATPDYPTAYGSTLSRAQVQAQAVAARQAGLVHEGEASPALPLTGTSLLTRAQVRAELAEAQRLGLVGGGERTVEYSPAQLESIRMAGERAVAMKVAQR